MVRRSRAAVGALLSLFSGLTGCAIADDVTLRAETMNATIGDYNNHAILLNIVRASQSEPLTFVAVTGGAPNTVFTGNAASPTITFSPFGLTSTVIGPTTASATGQASNILAVAAVDDPGSWQALLTPVDTATIGFFIKQNYPRELLFRLFIDRIRVKNPRLSNPNGYSELVNNPQDPSYLYYLKSLVNLVEAGLTVQIDRGSSKVGNNPASRVCYNRSDAILAQTMASKIPSASGGPFAWHAVPGDICGTWLPGQGTASNSTAPSSSTLQIGISSCSVNCKLSADGKAGGKPPTNQTSTAHVWYDLPPGRNEIQFSTRSAYAVFDYLGSLLSRNEGSEFLTIPDDPNLVTILRDSSQSCFTSVSYERAFYCVPPTAYNMKRAFAILHQVVGLNIVHSSSPAALAIRAVP